MLKIAYICDNVDRIYKVGEKVRGGGESKFPSTDEGKWTFVEWPEVNEGFHEGGRLHWGL